MNLTKISAMGVIIAVVFTVTITETIQSSDGFAASAVKLIYELEPGDTQILIWPISNIFEEKINLEFYATGEGSELLVFEEFASIEPHVRTEFDIFVVVPENHPDNIEFHPSLFALKRGDDLPDGATGMIVNSQVKVNPIIKIGDNPVFTPEIIVEEKSQIPKERIIKESTPDPIIEEETIEEKLARIKAANEITKTPETSPITSPVVEKTVTPTTEYQEEPKSISAPIVKSEATIETIKECSFIEVILSWFGMGKC